MAILAIVAVVRGDAPAPAVIVRGDAPAVIVRGELIY